MSLILNLTGPTEATPCIRSNVTRYWWICAIRRSCCTVGRSFVGVTIDWSRNNRPMAFTSTWVQYSGNPSAAHNT